ncbi:MAG: hypothetical protein Q7S43_05210 [bacterium]|nr:hypothetical protein [bacterium]
MVETMVGVLLTALIAVAQPDVWVIGTALAAALLCLSFVRRKVSARLSSHEEHAGATTLLALFGPKTSRQVAAELAKMRDWAVTNLQNRTVRSEDDQDQLEADAHEWEDKAVRLMEGHADPSEISDFKTLGTYTPKGLPALVSNVVHQSVNTNMLKRRNAKLRNEIAEQLDRLMKIIRKLEQKPNATPRA